MLFVIAIILAIISIYVIVKKSELGGVFILLASVLFTVSGLTSRIASQIKSDATLIKEDGSIALSAIVVGGESDAAPYWLATFITLGLAILCIILGRILIIIKKRKLPDNTGTDRSILKLSTRKRIIQTIGIIFGIWGILALVLFALISIWCYLEKESEPLSVILIMGGRFILGGIIAFSILTWQKRGRMLSIISSIIFFLDCLRGFIWTLSAYLESGMVKHADGSVSLFYMLRPPWYAIGFSLVGMLLCAYFIIILLHRDTKLIFERKGRVEGLE